MTHWRSPRPLTSNEADRRREVITDWKIIMLVIVCAGALTITTWVGYAVRCELVTMPFTN